MHLRSFLPAATLLAALTLYPVRMWAEDEEANLNDLPAAVQKTAHEQVGKNSVEEVEDTYEGGQHATEVEFREDGKKMAVVIAKDPMPSRRLSPPCIPAAKSHTSSRSPAAAPSSSSSPSRPQAARIS
jgi:hypothetical protein